MDQIPFVLRVLMSGLLVFAATALLLRSFLSIFYPQGMSLSGRLWQKSGHGVIAVAGHSTALNIILPLLSLGLLYLAWGLLFR